MTCTLTGHLYNNRCPHCMARHIKAVRSPEGKTTKKIQLSLLASVPLEMAEQVKEILRGESRVD